MKSLPTGTVTFLFTDIEGSTALLERLGDRRYAEILVEHQRLLRTAFEQGNGREVDTQGDSFLVAFPRARDAMAAAVAAQQALMQHAWSDSASVRVRMGLHTGKPLSATDRYIGLDVHRVARICAAGHGGQILLSDAVSDLAAYDLPSDVTLRDLGTHRLKDLKEPAHLLQVVHPDLQADFPPLKTIDVRPNNLPIQLTTFIGREREITEVKRVLRAARLVTITGSGGVGKTRLALRVAADVIDDHRDGVWLAEFAPIADPGLVPKMVASAMNVPEQPGREIVDTLVDALRPKTVLLVLDNCEHLLAACRDLAATLLRTCPHVRILATSREGLGVPGETLWRVPSLSLPEDLRHLPLPEELVLYDAVRLFADRAVATAPGFAITNDNAPAVAQVCQRLDGIPLAIELAAARMKALSVEQVAVRIDNRFRLLTGGSPVVPPRHQTLRAAIDWSYDLLSEPERVLLRRLSVFAGGWTLEAAEAVCAGESIVAEALLDLLTALVDKSLALPEMQHGEARYRLLETVRQYAGDRLVEAREEANVRRRHCDWYVALAEQAEPQGRGPAQAMWLERLEREHDNVRGALTWSVENDLEDGLRLAGALRWFWHRRGHYSEGRGRLAALLKSTSNASGSPRAKALYTAGYLAVWQGDYGAGRAFYEQSLTTWQKLADKQGIALVLGGLGLLASDQGDQARARACFEESLTLQQDVGDKGGVAICLLNLGVVARRQGDLAEARMRYLESLNILRELGDQATIATVLHNLGFVASLQGERASQRSYEVESLTIRQELGDKRGIADSLHAFSGIAMAYGRAKRAARLLGAADALRETTGAALSPAYLSTHTPGVDRVRSKLGDEIFAEMLAQGRAMTLEQAIEYALADRPEEGPSTA